MNMCYEETLVLPSNYVVMHEDEMIYIEGGVYSKYYWWGRYDYFNHNERVLLVDALAVAAMVTGFASMGIATATLGCLATIIWNHDEGYGIKLRYTNLTGYTGVYSLKKGEYAANKS